MKFPQLEVGRRFEFQGDTFVKSTPLVATRESDGQQKFMSRSAEVRPLDEDGAAPAPAPTPTAMVDADKALGAFDQFYRHCMEHLDQLSETTDSERVEQIRRDLEKERRKFRHQIAP